MTTQNPTTPPPRPTSSLGYAEIPVIGIFLILLVQTLVWASDFLIPVTAAFLGYFILNRPRRYLQGLGVPPVLSAMFFTAILSVVIVVALVVLSAPTAQFIEDFPSLIEDIKSKLATSGGTLQAINDASNAAEDITANRDDGTVAVEVVSDTGLAAALFSMAPALMSRILFMLILLFFLISSGDMFLTKTLESISSFRDKRRAVEVLHTIEEKLGNYLGGITLINIGLGVAVAIAMRLWGLPGAMVIGFMAFALNFVPFLGGLLGASIAAAIAFVSLDGAWMPLGVFATYAALTSIEGQVITPVLISKRMRLNTTVVFLFVAFFAWIWSVMGMVVALPILIVIKIACDETQALSTLGRFLGDADAITDTAQARA